MHTQTTVRRLQGYASAENRVAWRDDLSQNRICGWKLCRKVFTKSNFFGLKKVIFAQQGIAIWFVLKILGQQQWLPIPQYGQHILLIFRLWAQQNLFIPTINPCYWHTGLDHPPPTKLRKTVIGWDSTPIFGVLQIPIAHCCHATMYANLACLFFYSPIKGDNDYFIWISQSAW